MAQTSGLPVSFDDDLMEWQNGLIAGLTRQQADERYPLPAAKHPHTEIYGQESAIAFRARAETALSRLIHESPQDAVVAIVSHSGMLNMLFRSFLQLPVETAVSLSTGDTGIHHWRVSDGERSVLFCNSGVHLA